MLVAVVVRDEQIGRYGLGADQGCCKVGRSAGLLSSIEFWEGREGKSRSDLL